MGASAQHYPTSGKSTLSSRISALLRRVPLVLMTVIFSLIGSRYLFAPENAAIAAGISFSSPGGITVVRVGLAGFPLALAILGFTCLLSARRLLAGLYMVLVVISVVIAVRIFGMLMVHSTESARLLMPETVLLILSLNAVRLEWAVQREKKS
jgi:hypothetical protein